MDDAVAIADQLSADVGPVVLINVFVVRPDQADDLMAAWSADAGYMKAQPGFISTQLHRGIAGSGSFANYAVWESVAHFRAAFASPDFQARLSDYPENAKITPHLFKKVLIPGICVD